MEDSTVCGFNVLMQILVLRLIEILVLRLVEIWVILLIEAWILLLSEIRILLWWMTRAVLSRDVWPAWESSVVWVLVGVEVLWGLH